ncbi:MAG: hypothetical protein K0Q91_1398 [Fibrobacteria bacterium]|jgi:hypothetical protein|nr:hypothetical protein [Fibrobacteria bacterium]
MFFSVKKVFACSLLALSLGLTGCLTDDGDEDTTLSITSQPASVTVAIGDSATVSVSASGPGPIHYLWIATIGAVNDTLNDTTATIKFRVDASLSGATLRVVVSNASTTITSSAATIHVAFTAADTLTLGAQANAVLGSAIDLDSGKVWNSTVANANQAKIDLVYLYYNSKATLNGAKTARDSGIVYNINLTNTYSAGQVKDIKLVKVTAKPATLAIADSLYNSGAKVGSTVVAAGDKFVVKSTENNYQYVEIRSVAGTTAGTAGLSISYGKIR